MTRWDRAVLDRLAVLGDDCILDIDCALPDFVTCRSPVPSTGPGPRADRSNGMLGAMAQPDGAADLLFTGGHVHTVDLARPRAEAVAVHGERIVAVGTAADFAPMRGPRTRVVDLAGWLLLPGFQDAHAHPISAGIDQIECDVRESRGREGVLAAIRSYVETHPHTPWIIGSGWYMADFENGSPRREDLDAIVPERPAFLPNRDGRCGADRRRPGDRHVRRRGGRCRRPRSRLRAINEREGPEATRPDDPSNDVRELQSPDGGWPAVPA
jgi:hypothetical protein